MVFAFSPAMNGSSCCYTSTPRFGVVSALNFDHSNRCVVISHCFFNLHFSVDMLGRASLVAQTVKRLPTMWETWVWSLGRAYPLEKEMTTYSHTLAWKIPWMEEPGRQQSMGSQRVRHDWATSLVDMWYGAFFWILICHLYIFFDEASVQVFGPF